jgi:hypothetical protein
MGANYPAASLNADHISGGQLAFVDAGRGYPDVAVVIFNRQIATAQGGHAVVVYAVHYRDKLVAGM